MSDLIERQKAIDGLEGYIDDKGIFNQDRWFVHGIRTAITHLRGMPSAQPEIIRCKDCVHHIDGFFCRQANHHTSDKDHCASVFRAERRLMDEHRNE